MSFAEIALKNARKKFGSYLVFFVSTVFSVIIFYLFCAMYYNPAFEVYRFGTGKMNTLFRASAAAVLLFAVVFTMYSGSFFLRTQKKELAIYSLLGMRKGQIARLMFLETFFIGMLAVALGTLIGTLSSSFFTRLLMRFMAMGTEVSFAVSPQAVLVTAAAFCVLFGASGVRAYAAIYKYQLIDLLSAAKQSEGVPGYSVPGALISVALLAAGYIAAARMDLNELGLRLLLPALLVILTVALGTLLLFRNLVPMLIAALKKSRGIYYRTANFISVSQIAFRLKANSRLLAVVSLLTAVTVTMVSASYSLYHGLEDGVAFYAPYSYLAKDLTPEQHAAMLKAAADVGEVSVTADDSIVLYDVLIRNRDYALQATEDETPEPGGEVDAYLLSESGYLAIIAHTRTPYGEFSSISTSFNGGLSDAECYFLDGNMTDDHCKKLVGGTLSVTMGGKTLELTVTGAGLHKYIGLLDLFRHPTAVVSDRVFETYAKKAGADGRTVFTGLMFDDDMVSANTVDAMNSIVPARFTGGGLPGNISNIGMYRANFALYGSYVFIGLFIGVLFMLAVGSVMYYKLIMEAQEDAPRYEILRKTGMSGREALKCTARQLALTYGIPLAVGLVHTVFALLTYKRMLLEMGEETPTFQNALLVVAIYTLVYFAFYALSVLSVHKGQRA